MIAAGYASPLTLDTNGDTGSNNVYTPNPVNDSPDLLNLLSPAPACALLSSTSPEDFISETTGTAPVGNLGGTWYIQVVDNGVSFPDPPFGAGEVTAASIIVSCGFPTPVMAFDCSPFELTLLSEEIVETNCDQSDWNGAQIERTYQAIDECGNASTCTQVVNMKAPSFDDLHFPAQVSIECDGSNFDPETITPEISGGPEFGCFEVTADLHGLCDVTFTYEDRFLPSCGNGYKLLRTWTAINCCTGVFKQFTQLIGIEDSTGPEINVEDIVANSDPNECTGNLSFNGAIMDACSGVESVTVSYTVGGNPYLGNGTEFIVNVFPQGEEVTGLELGENEITITAKDSCLNVTTETITITIEDNSQPFAICDDDLNISLNNDGMAVLSAADFDEGSSDNCGVVLMEIRSLGCMGGDWAETAEFACCDVPEVTVELRVTDEAGNTNICWADIRIEDKVDPVITCPADMTVECNDDAFFHDIEEMEGATAEDLCGAEITMVMTDDRDNCGAGTVRRTFTAMDGSNNSDVCTQTITVTHVSDFTVQFPPDVTINTCPDELGDTGEPIVLDDDCELIAVSSEDLILTVADDACYKIIRTWTLINWCIFDDTQDGTPLGIPLPLPNTFRDDDGFFQFEQTISVFENEAPEITFLASESCDFSDACEGEMEMMAFGLDDCSSIGDLTYEYKIDAFSDGTFDLEGEGSDATGTYPYGDHIIKWIVTDGCGNVNTEEFEFSIDDCKNPTPVCNSGIFIEVMNDPAGTGCVEVWAEDMLDYAFDNCTSDSLVESTVLIRREGDTGAPSAVIEVCCEDVTGGAVSVEVWVEDEAGNSAFCVTSIFPQDNLGNCPGTGMGSAAIAGEILRETDMQDVEEVMVDVNGSTSMTGINGSFMFPGLNVGTNYTVSPAKDINPLNGVTTYDLVLISQHIIGTSPITSPYKLIAADVNGNGSVTTFDMVQLRQLILFVITDFPSNSSWRFVDMDYAFPVSTNPWSQPFPEVINVASLPNVGELAADFIGIKIGDVNNSAIPNTLLGVQDRDMPTTLVLHVDDVEMEAGESYTVDFMAKEFTEIMGYQFTMNFDKTAVEFAGVKPGAIQVTERNFGTALLDEGALTTSYNEDAAINIENGEVLFSLTFHAKADATLSDVINISNRYTLAEAYEENGTLKDLALGFNSSTGTTITGGTFELLQNKPNPFNESTLIGFYLPEAAEASLRVFDVTGKTLKVFRGDYARGYNEVTINRNELQSTGVLYYQLDTDNNSATKKMILID